MIFWPHLARYPAQIMPLCPAPITTPSYSNTFGILYIFISDLNASMSSIGTAGTSGTIGTMWPSSRSFNLQLEIFFHHLPTIATRSGDDGVRGMGSDPDLVQPLYGRAIIRELFHRPISSHLSGDLACYPTEPRRIWSQRPEI